MTTFDLSPLYRSTIGFDHLNTLFNNVSRESNGAYPPYNIELVADDQYRITLAVAGFSQNELEITTERSTLTVKGVKEKKDETQYLHKGIGFRNFERRFQLADYVIVTGADIKDGLLYVDLERQLPDAMKSRTIEIGSNATSAKVIENK